LFRFYLDLLSSYCVLRPFFAGEKKDDGLFHFMHDLTKLHCFRDSARDGLVTGVLYGGHQFVQAQRRNPNWFKTPKTARNVYINTIVGFGNAALLMTGARWTYCRYNYYNVRNQYELLGNATAVKATSEDVTELKKQQAINRRKREMQAGPGPDDK
jgi:hypothetical protein